jgi:hypothetical protein
MSYAMGGFENAMRDILRLYVELSPRIKLRVLNAICEEFRGDLIKAQVERGDYGSTASDKEEAELNK